MNFQEAREQLKELAGSRYNTITYSETTYKGKVRPVCKLYIEEVGHTDDFRTWEEALAQIERMDIGVKPEYQGPEGASHV